MKQIKSIAFFALFHLFFVHFSLVTFGSDDEEDSNSPPQRIEKKKKRETVNSVTASLRSTSLEDSKKSAHSSNDDDVSIIPTKKDKTKKTSTSSSHIKKTGSSQEKNSPPFDIDKITGVHDKFLAFDQKNNLFEDNVNTQLNNFKIQYNAKNKSTLNFTGFSARARIYLLTEIINLKVSKLPENYFDDPSWKNEFWKKENGKFYIIDKFPTILKVGNFSYTLFGGPTANQKGSGSLLGVNSATPRKGEKYDAVLKFLQQHQNKYDLFGQSLLVQKKDGRPIQPSAQFNAHVAQYLNGLNLLLDYEVARRQVEDDEFVDVPILSSIHYLLTNFNSENLKKFFEGDQEGTGKVSPLTGKDRRKFVERNILPEQSSQQDLSRSKAIRAVLKFSHKDTENSEEAYSEESSSEEAEPENLEEGELTDIQAELTPDIVDNDPDARITSTKKKASSKASKQKEKDD